MPVIVSHSPQWMFHIFRARMPGGSIDGKATEKKILINLIYVEYAVY